MRICLWKIDMLPDSTRAVSSNNVNATSLSLVSYWRKLTQLRRKLMSFERKSSYINFRKNKTLISLTYSSHMFSLFIIFFNWNLYINNISTKTNINLLKKVATAPYTIALIWRCRMHAGNLSSPWFRQTQMQPSWC